LPNTDRADSTAEARRELGARLRLLRRSAGLTQSTVAEATGQHVTRVSRIENGGQPPTEQNIRDWCAVCGAPAEVADLVAAARAVEGSYQEWARLSRAGLKRLGQPHSLASYRRTRLFRIHEPLVLPGVLQTEAYYRAMIKFWYGFLDAPDDTEAAVADRRDRTAVARQPHRRITAVLGEQALRTRFTTFAEHADQLAHLLELQRHRNITVSVIPADAQRRALATLGFWILDDNAVALETPTAALKVTRPAEIGRYVTMFEALRAEAVHGRAARTLIEDALAGSRAH
jgi:transcriptional regulator with XRE-family HTH domain